ncbi:uncharacterized protein LOC135810166 [Sycon ciliatum]|uniref:uncharacterized protein LOC135810166 n=1 Tax=Sycon ciliatum TaxID=27933 RepID=UPI0031F6742F|eukprot:scpid63716/ scgid32833/ 
MASDSSSENIPTALWKRVKYGSVSTSGEEQSCDSSSRLSEEGLPPRTPSKPRRTPEASRRARELCIFHATSLADDEPEPHSNQFVTAVSSFAERRRKLSNVPQEENVTDSSSDDHVVEAATGADDSAAMDGEHHPFSQHFRSASGHSMEPFDSPCSRRSSSSSSGCNTCASPSATASPPPSPSPSHEKPRPKKMPRQFTMSEMIVDPKVDLAKKMHCQQLLDKGEAREESPLPTVRCISPPGARQVIIRPASSRTLRSVSSPIGCQAALAGVPTGPDGSPRNDAKQRSISVTTSLDGRTGEPCSSNQSSPPMPRPRSAKTLTARPNRLTTLHRSSRFQRATSTMSLTESTPFEDDTMFYDEYQAANGSRPQSPETCSQKPTTLEVRLEVQKGATITNTCLESPTLKRHIAMACQLDDLLELMTASGWCLVKLAKRHEPASDSPKLTKKMSLHGLRYSSAPQANIYECSFHRCAFKRLQSFDSCSAGNTGRFSRDSTALDFCSPPVSQATQQRFSNASSVTNSSGCSGYSSSMPGNISDVSSSGICSPMSELFGDNLSEKKAADLQLLLQFFDIPVAANGGGSAPQ